jgi:putative hydrolase of the HAD superfamily
VNHGCLADGMRKPAAVLFDLYDTLVLARGRSSFYHSVPTALGVDPERWLVAYRALGRAAMTGAVPDLTTRVRLACQHAGRACGPERVAAIVSEHLASFYAIVHIDPQALATLTTLRAAGLRLAIVSNAARPSERVLDMLGLRAATDAVVMSYAVGVLKPDPRIYRAALDAIGVAPAAAVFVGDGGDGELGGARQLGISTVLIERGLPHSTPARADADFCCRDLSEVAGLLLAGR